MQFSLDYYTQHRDTARGMCVELGAAVHQCFSAAPGKPARAKGCGGKNLDKSVTLKFRLKRGGGDIWRNDTPASDFSDL